MGKSYKHLDIERENVLRNLEARGFDLSKSFLHNLPTANLKKLLAANMQMNDERGYNHTRYDV